MNHRSRPHPPRRLLVAMTDGEVPWPQRLRLLGHLGRCSECRGRFARVRREHLAVHVALLPLTIPPRSDDAWARLVLLHRAPNAGRLPPAVWGLAASLVLLFGLYRWVATPRGPTAEFLAAIERLPTRSDLRDAPPARIARKDARFIEQLLALASTGAARVVRDDCCDDHDGEGPADDGIFAAQLPEARLALHVMYDDADGTRTLSTGDLVRSVARTPFSGQARGPARNSALLAMSHLH